MNLKKKITAGVFFFFTPVFLYQMQCHFNAANVKNRA